GYVLLCSPHILGHALVTQMTPIRVVCWNTLQMALGVGLKGKGDKAFSMPHSMHFDDKTKERAREALGLATAQMDEFKEAATLLAQRKAEPEMVKEFFCNVMKLDEAEEAEPRILQKFQAALEAPDHGALLPSALGTWWGALNAVTRVVDHEL